MFDIGDYVVYGLSGVCQVRSVGKLSLSNDDKIYYTLLPVYSKTSTVYTPVDNEKVAIRKVMSKDEAEKLVESIDEIGLVEVGDEKRREDIYKKAIRTCDSREWVSVMRTSYTRIMERKNNGKKVIGSDEKYLKQAEDFLYGELAIALDIDKMDVQKYIESKMTT